MKNIVLGMNSCRRSGQLFWLYVESVARSHGYIKTPKPKKKRATSEIRKRGRTQRDKHRRWNSSRRRGTKSEYSSCYFGGPSVCQWKVTTVNKLFEQSWSQVIFFDVNTNHLNRVFIIPISNTILNKPGQVTSIYYFMVITF